MAAVFPFRGIRFNPELFDVGTALAPPYDVISDRQREALYAIGMRNIVRIDYGKSFDDDVPGKNDQYTRAAGHLHSWIQLHILRRDHRPSFYISEQEFLDAAGHRWTRRGLFALIRALPWSEADVKPHEHTRRGPKEDRLRLMRATSTQTSPVFAFWKNGQELNSIIERATNSPSAIAVEAWGEIAPERHRLWIADEPALVESVASAFAETTLYIADGHHRFETSAAYAEEARNQGDTADDPSQFVLMYLCAGEDPAVQILPTHRLLLSGEHGPYQLDELLHGISGEWVTEPYDNAESALKTLGAKQADHHAFVVCDAERTVLIARARNARRSPVADLDVQVLQDEILSHWPDAISSLDYTRSADKAVGAVHDRRAQIAFILNPCTVNDVVAVADARETMPAKSTYFYPKVPTGLVLNPLYR